VSIPAIIIVCLTKNPQIIVTYTGGICGTFILFIIPVSLVLFARQKLRKQGTLFQESENPNASWFQGLGWSIFIYFFAGCTLFSVIWGLFKGNAGS
jgi:glycerol uptake facilitator-like aquaporin